MVLFAQHVRANMFTGDVAAGPVPTFFLANTEGEVKELMDHPQEIFKEIQGVMASLVKPEIFGLPAAIQLLKKPREGLARPATSGGGHLTPRATRPRRGSSAWSPAMTQVPGFFVMYQ